MSERHDTTEQGPAAGNVAGPTWCDGTPHSPTAIPPLPFHDWRYDLDNPWLICARCAKRDAPEPARMSPTTGSEEPEGASR